ncbi:MAG: retroviral-like aspartic protease family protein [Chloroflexi bacterium]|nr:retroviral-like aspartic protease family protein [Chloroflexota bacterium]
MGSFRIPIQVGDPQGQRFETVEALVDTGATFTVVPGSLLRRLGVQPSRRAAFELGDGRMVEKEVGQTRVRLDGQQATTTVVFGDEGTEPLLGVVTLEEFLLAPDPVHQRLLPVRGLLKATQAKMLATRVGYGEALVELGKEDSNIVALDADLAKSTQSIMFGKAFPDRFFYLGAMEQNMMSMAAGLASTGKTVFASTFAVFATSRAFDQVRISISWPVQNVKIVASHGGIATGEDGASAQSIEDLALMTSLPPFTVIVPCDYYETKRAVKAAARTKGPFYIRVARPASPLVYESEEAVPFEIGKAIKLREGTDATVIACGLMVPEALEAVDALAREGVRCRFLDMHTLKPADEEAIVAAARETGAIVTAEEHQPHGGLFGAVAEVLARRAALVPVEPIGLKGYGTSGTYRELFRHFGLTPEAVQEAVRAVVRRKGA